MILLAAQREVVEAALERILPVAGASPVALTSAMRYSVLAGGKRLRPVLCLALADVCGFAGSVAELAEVSEAAAALELIHTYSLIHDDLPCMDDDSLRRGRPTCHVVHGEAMALLAGDALQTVGFEILSTRPRGPAHVGTRAEAAAMVARAIGVDGMAGGQALDLVETGRTHEGEEARARLRQIHAMKTGRLLAVSASLGALYAGAAADLRREVDRYGDRLGLLFQIADDLLDVTADTATLGKTAGKDSAQAKLTYPALFGVAGARAEMARVLEEACDAARVVEGRDGILSALATWAARRDR
ncbi:MAG TPA: farnesyl diphosphate synthase [Thermoanaerobaculia bacterium]